MTRDPRSREKSRRRFIIVVRARPHTAVVTPECLHVFPMARRTSGILQLALEVNMDVRFKSECMGALMGECSCV